MTLIQNAHAQAPIALAARVNQVFFQPQPTSTHFTPLPAPLYGGNPALPEIALTFDDGPHPGSTLKIVAILKRFSVKATFFCVGQHVQSYPDYVRQEYANGNLVEDHTWTHPDLRLLSSADVAQQLASTANEIERVTGAMPTLFRPPYGIFNWSIFAQARRMALSSIIWNVDPKDWSMPGTNTIIWRVLSAAGNGSIVLMHDGGGDRSQTVAALPTIITTLRQRGFRFVTVEQMIRDLAQKTSGSHAITVPGSSTLLFTTQAPCLQSQALPMLKPNRQADVIQRNIRC
ncbi:MAG TPA: polysaccharide deacetylase family protein [Ktedonobacteraceae bacterium]